MKTWIPIVLTICLGSSPSFGASYWIQAYTCNSSTETRAQDTEPVHWEGTFSDCLGPEAYVELDGSAGRGSLRALSHAVDAHLSEYDYYSSGMGGVHAGMQFEDVVFEGPTGTVTTTMELNVHAILAAASTRGTSTSHIEIDVYLGSHAQVGVASVQDGSDPDPPYTSGLLASTLSGDAGGAVIDTSIRTEPFEVPTNSTLILLIVLRASASAYDPIQAADASCDAGNTLSFPRNTPVFDLPAGYTVNSMEAGITDNLWTPDVHIPDSSWGALKSRY